MKLVVLIICFWNSCEGNRFLTYLAECSLRQFLLEMGEVVVLMVCC